MESKTSDNQQNKLKLAGLLVTIGIVYGDIGTSPLYVMKSLISGNGGLASISKEFIYGSLSLVFWTITLLTTVKYVGIALRADNHGEGGIFSLYALIRKKAKWLIIPAIIGGSSLLADGILTPAVTVTTAIEGLRGIPFYVDTFGSSQQTVIIITLIIISFLFLIQRFGTELIGRFFGPIMFLWFSCMAVVLYFQNSHHMEAAYGLAITITMLMTTILLYNYLTMKHISKFISIPILLFFGGLELAFFASSVTKFFHGGFVTVIMALLIIGIMMVWNRAFNIERNVAKEVPLSDFIDRIKAIRDDNSIPMYATNLVYLTSKARPGYVDSKVMYSIFDKQPKRAQVYWFVNVDVTDQPRTMEYVVEKFDTNFIIKVQLHLGFRIEQQVSTYLRQVVIDLMKAGEIENQPQRWTTAESNRNVGDFCFVLVREELSTDSELSSLDRFVMQIKLTIKKIALSPIKWFGLEYTDVKLETVPLLVGKRKKTQLKRVYH